MYGPPRLHTTYLESMWGHWIVINSDTHDEMEVSSVQQFEASLPRELIRVILGMTGHRNSRLRTTWYFVCFIGT